MRMIKFSIGTFRYGSSIEEEIDIDEIFEQGVDYDTESELEDLIDDYIQDWAHDKISLTWSYKQEEN